MRLAIPANDQNMESGVCISFGRAPWYAIYDTLSEKMDFMENSAAQSPGGAGIKASQLLVDAQVSAILTPRCGENAAEVLESAQIAIFKTQGEDLMENIMAFQDAMLDPLSEIHPGHYGK